MTRVYLTIDTEYSSGLANGACPVDRTENFARSIACFTPDGPAGITYQLKMFERHGIRAVFFVDPMPALLWGIAAIEDVVTPILNAGQDVQLHCHTEWLRLAGAGSPLRGLSGGHIKDFDFDEQCRILDWARDALVAAGAPKPVAFRAGNYGANNDTLRALAAVGLRYDSSHCPALVGTGACDIDLGAGDQLPMLYEGVIEVPAGCIAEAGGGFRHAQITALSLREMKAAIRNARNTNTTSFTLVSHSFELINRRKQAVNRVVQRRFDGLCSWLEAAHNIATANYRGTPPLHVGETNLPRRAGQQPLAPSVLRTWPRLAEQAVSNIFY